MSNSLFMVKTKVDHLAERVAKIIFEVDKFIIAIEEMKTDSRGRKSWKGACNRAIRKLVTLKGKLDQPHKIVCGFVSSTLRSTRRRGILNFDTAQ